METNRSGNVARRRRGGFSLIEAMIAAGILGIALVGLVRLHFAAMQGTAKSASIGNAAEAARQLAEVVATTDFDALPVWAQGCGPGANAPLPPNWGCRSNSNTLTVADAQCSLFLNDVGVPTPSQVGQPFSVGPNPSGSSPGLRLDLAVSAHPDLVNYPETAVLTVAVCWREGDAPNLAAGGGGGAVHEVRTSRILVRGLR